MFIFPDSKAEAGTLRSQVQLPGGRTVDTNIFCSCSNCLTGSFQNKVTLQIP